MSGGGEPEFGSGGYYGGGAGGGAGGGGGGEPSGTGGPPGMSGLPGLGGLFGRGGFPGFGNMGRQMGPAGRFGVWPSCGCSGCLIILAGVLLVFGGFLRLIGQ
jgi:hypothetical protein